MRYYSLKELINRVDEPNRSICLKLLDDNREKIENALGSAHNHQNWEGGYVDHLTEIMNIAIILYNSFSKLRKLSFALSDALLLLFLHDLEKPWRWIKDDQNNWIKNPNMIDKEIHGKEFVENKIKEYDFQLTDDHWNGLHYVEGEKGVYKEGERTQKPLAAFAHLCDTWSARGGLIIL
ncbi:MAG TPA: hypothetical protein VJI98_04395 [Candidatus Nanoarchaeia archaeon]|nr:hypothetical protein [Candidatus Nanoarchaeia archaeon]